MEQKLKSRAGKAQAADIGEIEVLNHVAYQLVGQLE
jgi:hypothetical protein